MSKNKKLLFPITLLLVSLYLVSCYDSETEFSAIGDVLFLKATFDDQEVFATSYYVYGNSSLSSASVTTPLATTIQLEPYSTNTYIYYLEPDSSQYTTSYPTEGSYLFDVTSADGNTFSVTDDQDFYDLDFAQIDSLYYDDTYDGYYLSWNVISGADSYAIYLYNSENELVFISNSIDADAPEYILLYGYYGTWYDSLNSSETYTIQIRTIKYDSDATTSDYSYNIQEISTSNFNIVWGEVE